MILHSVMNLMEASTENPFMNLEALGELAWNDPNIIHFTSHISDSLRYMSLCRLR